MIGKPVLIPTTPGTLRRNPKLTPDAITRVLFGPGVPQVASVNTINDR